MQSHSQESKQIEFVSTAQPDEKSESSEGVSFFQNEMHRMNDLVKLLETKTKDLPTIKWFGWKEKVSGLRSAIGEFLKFRAANFSNERDEQRFTFSQLNQARELLNVIILRANTVFRHDLNDASKEILDEIELFQASIYGNYIESKRSKLDGDFYASVNQASKDSLKGDLANKEYENKNLTNEVAAINAKNELLEKDREELQTYRSNALTTAGIARGLVQRLADTIDYGFASVPADGEVTAQVLRLHLQTVLASKTKEIDETLKKIIPMRINLFNKPANDKSIKEAESKEAPTLKKAS